MSMFYEHVRAQHTVCTIAEMTSLHSLAYVALLASNVDVGDVDDDAAHRSGLDAALDEPKEEDGVRHLGPGADLGGGCRGCSPCRPITPINTYFYLS